MFPGIPLDIAREFERRYPVLLGFASPWPRQCFFPLAEILHGCREALQRTAGEDGRAALMAIPGAAELLEERGATAPRNPRPTPF